MEPSTVKNPLALPPAATIRAPRPELRQQVESLRLPASATSRASGVGTVATVLCVLLLASNVAFAWLWWNGSAKTAPSSAAEAAGASVAQATTADRSPAPPPNTLALASNGYIIPAHQVLLSPKVSGMVLQLNIEEGMRVKRGDVLAVIEKTEYQSEFDKAQATSDLAQQKLHELERGFRPDEIIQSEAELEEARQLLTEAERDYGRIQRLRTDNASSEQALSQAESQFFAQQQRVGRLTAALNMMREGPRIERIEMARAELRQAQADLDRATWRLDNCTIRAPIDGTILRKNAEEGNIVNPIAFNGSFSLGEMADLSDLEVELDIQEREISKVFKGQRCRIETDAYKGRQYEGVVDRLMPIADRAKGAIPVRVKVTVPSEEEGIYLKPEMLVLVTFLSEDQAAETVQPTDPTPAATAD